MCQTLVKKSPLTINHTPWKMPNENTQKLLPPVPQLPPAVNSCELCEIMRLYSTHKRLSVFGSCKATINWGFGLLQKK